MSPYHNKYRRDIVDGITPYIDYRASSHINQTTKRWKRKDGKQFIRPDEAKLTAFLAHLRAASDSLNDIATLGYIVTLLITGKYQYNSNRPGAPVFDYNDRYDDFSRFEIYAREEAFISSGLAEHEFFELYERDEAFTQQYESIVAYTHSENLTRRLEEMKKQNLE